jgi:ribonuclease HII
MLLPYLHENVLEAGCDEAGRGCLAGPVFAAAVVLPPGFQHPLLNDSKQLTEANRDLLRAVIEHEALAWAVEAVSAADIDRINILQASIEGMHRAVKALALRPEWLLIDGNRFRPVLGLGHTCVVGGDAKYASIAAASVLAKTHRDAYMTSLHEQFPHYGWATNKGYPTRAHRNAIREHGTCEHHRMTFRMQ